MVKNKITTVVFDAGGVLLYINRRRKDIVRSLLSSMGYASESIDRALDAGNEFDIKYFENKPYIHSWEDEKDWLTGRYSAIAKSIDRDNGSLLDKLFMLTFDTFQYFLYPEVRDVLEYLKKDYKLGVISNALPSLDWAFDALDIRKYFHSIIISAYEGAEKPCRDIYISGVRKLNCRFEECIFVDDRIENVEAAQNLGMRGFLLDRNKDTLKVLIGLLDNKNDAI